MTDDSFRIRDLPGENVRDAQSTEGAGREIQTTPAEWGMGYCLH